MDLFSFRQIGIIYSPWKEKFAVPRQPGLITDGGGELHLNQPYNQPASVRGLEEFSHLWILFVFHKNRHPGWHATVRPPSLGGQRRKGVFASRAPFRPNPIGLSLVELKGIRFNKQQVILDLASLDLVDGTPVIDIKPYLPYAEAKPKATAGYADQLPTNNIAVCFSQTALMQLAQHTEKYIYLQRFIREVIAQDPRPSWNKRSESAHCYSAWLLDFNVTWQVTNQIAEVLAIESR